MKEFIFIELFVVLIIPAILAAEYDEILARYKIWPMASAAYGDHPELCVKDNYASGEV